MSHLDNSFEFLKRDLSQQHHATGCLPEMLQKTFVVFVTPTVWKKADSQNSEDPNYWSIKGQSHFQWQVQTTQTLFTTMILQAKPFRLRSWHKSSWKTHRKILDANFRLLFERTQTTLRTHNDMKTLQNPVFLRPSMASMFRGTWPAYVFCCSSYWCRTIIFDGAYMSAWDFCCFAVAGFGLSAWALRNSSPMGWASNSLRSRRNLESSRNSTPLCGLLMVFSVRGFNSTLDAMARFAESSEEAKQVEVLHETFYEDPQQPQQQANATQQHSG